MGGEADIINSVQFKGMWRALACANSLEKQGRAREARRMRDMVRRIQRDLKLPPRTEEHLKGRWLYRIWSADDTLLYVGITDRGRVREREHARTKPWWPEVHHVTVEPVSTRAELAHLERVAIRKERPKYNVHHNK